MLTLDSVQLISGYGDISHYFHLDPASSFSLLDSFTNQLLQTSQLSSFDFLPIISHAHEIKKTFIEIDEFDKGKRKLLNFGHSFAHSLENVSNYSIHHGVAVIIGCFLAYTISYKKGYFASSFTTSILPIFSNQYKLLALYGNTSFPCLPLHSIINGLRSDKKNTSSNAANLILPSSDGPFLCSLDYSELTSLLSSSFGPFEDIGFSKLFSS